MERSLFAFIWKYSKRQQILLLGVTVLTFPFLYATLELPKRIINDAISSMSPVIDVFGVEVTQIQFLLLLSFGYLGAVLCHGLLKMRLNTMKGVLSERMLRRFRYQLIARMMRFPKSYFRRTSQGELVSMVTSEAEPMGGLMGDAVAQPVFQAGQMIIIVVFLFLQSVWFGLAGVALIPLQAYLIPLLQRQINTLNKTRIIEVRALASEIGETAAGASDLRINGGWRYRRAEFTDRLGRLFAIRLRIYHKKFFMKFLNNFITQLTPFFFYSVGGVLAIRGEITVGALVAALAAYKDLSAPWKELLTYYNQVQDMSLRWEIVTERFAPRNMIDEDLFEGAPETVPHLRGEIAFKGVTVRDENGGAVLEDVTLEIPAGARVALKVPNQNERAALADLLTREILPSRGSVTVAGQDLIGLHQAVIAARIGYAQSRPYFFNGTLGANLMMPLRNAPKAVLWDPRHKDRDALEARRSGNSPDRLDVDWLDPSIGEFAADSDVRGWWFQLTRAMGIDEFMVRRVLDAKIDPTMHPDLADSVVALRETVWRALEERGLDDGIVRFDPDAFNPTVPLAGNLLFAGPKQPISLEKLAADKSFLGLVVAQGLGEQIIGISQTVVDTLHQTFGTDGTEHPLFEQLGIEPALYEQLTDIARRRKVQGDGAISEEEFALLMTVPFLFTAEQIGPAFPESFKDEIVDIRRTRGAQLREATGDMFVKIAPENYLPRLSLTENLIFGRISRMAASQTELIQDVVLEVLADAGLSQQVAETIWDIDIGIGGANVPGVILERAAFSRAALKRPDILVLDKALASHDEAQREKTRRELRSLLPDATLIFMEDDFADPEAYDLFVEIRNGRVDGLEQAETFETADNGSDDFQRKLARISRAPLFQKLDPRNQRLLAFSAQWYRTAAGQTVFAAGDPPDAAYLCVSGRAEIVWYEAEGARRTITTIEPGRLVGDLAIFLDEARRYDMLAMEPSVFLRIGAREYLSVVRADPEVAFSLLQTVSGYLTTVAELAREAGVSPPEEAARSNPGGDLARPTAAE